MTRRLLLLVLLLVVAVAGCQSQTPTQRAWPAYSNEVKKILGEYDEAMHKVSEIDVALTAPPSAGGTSLTADSAVKQIEADVIPKLDKIATHAAAIQTPNSSRLTAMHRPLAEALAAKADAYKTMTKAFKDRDTALFDKGVAKLAQAGDQLAGFRKEFSTAVLEGGPRE